MKRAASARKKSARPRALDNFDLYELAAQAPAKMARFLRAVHGGEPRILAEDFCGSGAVARAWLEADPKASAVCVDKDARALGAMRKRCAPDQLARLTLRRMDVLRATDKADVLAALNFPIGYWHERDDLVAYLRHARSRLHKRGVGVVDLYGGATAFTSGRYPRALQGGALYEWEQREADALTGRVRNAMHFRVGGRWRRDAFTYDWRLWSIPELRDAFEDAGFRRVDIYNSLADAVDGRGRVHVAPIRSGAELEENWVVYVVGRV